MARLTTVDKPSVGRNVSSVGRRMEIPCGTGFLFVSQKSSEQITFIRVCHEVDENGLVVPSRAKCKTDYCTRSVAKRGEVCIWILNQEV